MTHSTTFVKMALSVAAMGIAMALPQAAKADHDSYEYSGKPVGCAGEAHMIEALRCLEKAYQDHGRDPRHQAVLHAERSAAQASRAVESVRASRYLRWATDHLYRYYRSHSILDLDDAAGLIRKALYAEQQAHLAHHHPPVVVRPAPVVVVPRGPYGPGPGYGPIGPPPRSRGGIMIRFGKGRGGLFFKF